MGRQALIIAAVLLPVCAGQSWGARPEKVVQLVSVAGQGGAAPASHKPEAGRSARGEVPVEQIQMAIRKYFEGEWGSRVKAVQVTVIDPAAPVKTPAGVVGLQVLPAATEGAMGRRNVNVQITVDGKAWKTIEVLVDLAAQIDVVVPNRAVKADEIIEADDLTTARVVTYDLKPLFLTDPGMVEGKSAARPLQPNIPLRQGFLKAPILVKKGDRVLIEAKRGGLSIQTTGVTKGSGQVGQMVMVANLDSGRELRARVVAQGLVEVDF